MVVTSHQRVYTKNDGAIRPFLHITPYHNVYNGGGSPKCIKTVYIISKYITVGGKVIFDVVPT